MYVFASVCVCVFARVCMCALIRYLQRNNQRARRLLHLVELGEVCDELGHLCGETRALGLRGSELVPSVSERTKECECVRV